MSTATKTLRCPYCDSDNLHPTSIHVFGRTAKDSDIGIVASTLLRDRNCVPRTNVQPLTGQSRNPSSTGDGIRLLFECDGCSDIPTLILYEHKGLAFQEWETN